MASEGFALGAGIVIFFLIFALAIFSMVFWILMLVDVVQRKFKKEDEKVVWILIIALLGIVGALVYYFVVKRPNKK
jgi:Co/Zn/Cd efflux system component